MVDTFFFKCMYIFRTPTLWNMKAYSSNTKDITYYDPHKESRKIIKEGMSAFMKNK